MNYYDVNTFLSIYRKYFVRILVQAPNELFASHFIFILRSRWIVIMNCTFNVCLAFTKIFYIIINEIIILKRDLFVYR